ncbi:MAG TPA: tRNA 4-thiouridine(8) synthase ThiI [Methanoregulaceae archaeon]|nr:tRNA 4-thiouridine(8) synthase ThiI [Methanoregulaceae archaeon]
MERYLVRYGEIFLKSDPVRRKWEQVLANEIRERMPGVAVRTGRGRIWLDGPVDREALSRVFGVVSFSPTVPCFLEDLDRAVPEYVTAHFGGAEQGTFAVRVKRVGNHSFSSQEKAASLGALIGSAHPGLRVDLSNPDITLHVEIRDERCYLYHEIFPGPGGLPPGTQGTLVALVSGGIDSPVAAYMMMKRGCRILPLMVALDGYLDETAVTRAEAVIERLRPYQPDIALHVLHDGYLLRAKEVLRQAGQERYTCVLCKRRMYRLAGMYATEHGALGIVTGEALGQVASQTLDNLRALDEAASLPVYRPLIGFDKEEIITIARRIGTFATSITPATGCQAVPSMPTTKAKLELVHTFEAAVEGEPVTGS